MVTMKNSNSFLIFSQEECNFLTNYEQSVERRSFVIFPFEADYILKDILIDRSTTDIDGDVFIIVMCL